MKFTDNENIKVVEVEVSHGVESQLDNKDQNTPKTDLNDWDNNKTELSQESKNVPKSEAKEEVSQKDVKAEAIEKKKKTHYGWAFFVALMFIGKAIAGKHGMYIGMGFGVLFFIEPIYEKVMEKIKNL